MKRFLLSFCIFFYLFSPYSLADDNLLYEDLEPFTYSSTIQSQNDLSTTYSSNICSIDRKSGIILFEKNLDQKVAIASTTKIMTCILALENIDFNENPTFKISKNAASATGSTLGLKYNKTISFKDLLYGLMLRSGNDCAILIAEIISGDIENFSKLMNDKANKLGLKNTNFITPHGLDSEQHYSTAYDLALLTDYALKNDIFKQIVSTKNITITLNDQPHEIHNTNELLGVLPGIYGVKTGFTFNAGRCLVTAYKNETFDIITVVLGANSKSIRSKDTKTVINYINNNFTYVNIENTINKTFNNYLNILPKHINLYKTNTKPEFYLEKLSNYSFPVKNINTQNFSFKLYIKPYFSNHTPQNSIVGKLSVYNEYKLYSSLNIYLKNNLISNNVNYYFFNSFKNIKF